MSVKANSKKPKKNFTSKEPEVFWHLNAKGEKLWGFRHRYYDALGKRREKPKQGLASENIAIRELLKVKTDLVNGNIKSVDNSDITVSEWLDIWYDTHENEWGVSTRGQREEAIRNHMKPLLGKNKLAQLTRSTYRRDYINVLLKSLEPSTVQLLHNLFKIAINSAVEEEIIPRNRFFKIVIPDKRKSDNFLNAEELKTFLLSAKEVVNITNYTAMLLLAFTGLRKGELQGLRWSDIDFEGEKLTVDRTRDNHGVRPPKTDNSYRTILIDELLLNQLKIYRKWCIETKFFHGKNLNDEDYIFISYRNGAPISNGTLNHNFTLVSKGPGLKRVTPHGLRHTHATILMSQTKPRIPVNYIAERLGNTPQMIIDTYGHTVKELEIESVEAFNKVVNL